jgi:general secretion pathway protein I
LFRSREPDDSGFTLIEALVALAVVTVMLTSIGALVSTSVRGTISMERHLANLEVGRVVLTALPERDELKELSGEISDRRWQLDVAPFVVTQAQARTPPTWVPRTVRVTVQSPSGTPLQIDTVRLQRRGGG